MTIAQLIQCIKKYCHLLNEEDKVHHFQREFASYFIYYLEGLDLHQNQQIKNIQEHLNILIHHAIILLTNSTDNIIVHYSKAFASILGENWSKVIHISKNNCSEKSVFSEAVVDLFVKSLEHHQNHFATRKRESLQSLFSAEHETIKIYFNIFLQKVYQQGLFKIIKNSGCTMMKGTFGNVQLSSHVDYDKISLLFKNAECQITYTSKYFESFGFHFQLESLEGNLVTCLQALQQVASLWPDNTNEQMNIFQGSYKFNF